MKNLIKKMSESRNSCRLQLFLDSLIFSIHLQLFLDSLIFYFSIHLQLFLDSLIFWLNFSLFLVQFSIEKSKETKK